MRMATILSWQSAIQNTVKVHLVTVGYKSGWSVGKFPESKCPLRHHSFEWGSSFTSQALCLSGLWKITTTKLFSQSLEHSGCSVLVLGPASYKQTSVFCELFALSPLKYFKANTLCVERTPISLFLLHNDRGPGISSDENHISGLFWSQVWPQLPWWLRR